MLSIPIPKNVELSIANGYVKITGPYGVLIKKIGTLQIGIHENRLYVLNAGNQTNNFLSLLRGYLVGVSKGFRRKLRLIGVGYRASITGTKLSLKVGFSHEMVYEVPADVTITCSKAKGTIILIRGKESQRVNQVASEIRRLRSPDSYKGKGIHYDREVLRLKKGKREGA